VTETDLPLNVEHIDRTDGIDISSSVRIFPWAILIACHRLAQVTYMLLRC
jgi:hypothetical protein